MVLIQKEENMGFYIGAVYLPYVSEFSVDNQAKTIEVVKHLGAIPPHVAEFKTDVRLLNIEGTLMQANGTVKTVEEYAEDINALIGQPAAFNSIYNIMGRTGWAVVKAAAAPKTADEGDTRKFTASGLFMPKSKYQTRMRTVPAIRANPFGFTLGVNDCDNYVAIPIGATYTGGDGSTITRAGEDGDVTLVLATALNNINFDVPKADVNNGEVKIWDEMGEALEADWVRVYNVDHEFIGKAVIQNSLYRVILNKTNGYISVYRFTTVWTLIENFTCGTFNHVQLKTINDDKLTLNLSSGVEITVRRGHPILIDTGADALLAVTLTPADQTTTTENYLVLAANTYICSDAVFSIVNITKNLGSGKKWIYYEAYAPTAEDIAHQAMVDQNLTRELIIR